MTIYEQNDFKDREEYLEHLKEEYDSDLVIALSDLLGESEDFDGLVTELSDYECYL